MPTTTQFGANINHGGESSRGLLFANAARCARPPRRFDRAPMQFNSAGMPLSDFALTFGTGNGNKVILAGAYDVSFPGQVSRLWWGDGVSTISQLAYDAATNTTTAVATAAADKASDVLELNFEGTRRTPGATPGTGLDLDDMKIMRPLLPGSGQSHGYGEMFHRETVRRLGRYRYLRMLDPSQANATPRDRTAVSEWSDRVKPNVLMQAGLIAEGVVSATAWEHLIALANLCNVGLWINVPHNATDDYRLNLFRLIEYGSDAAGNVYTSPQANPFYKPLAPGLFVIIEHGNELWNFAPGFHGYGYLEDTAAAELAADPAAFRADVFFDGETNTYAPIFRLAARGVLRNAVVAAQVFGSNRRRGRYHIAFMSQADNLYALIQATIYLRRLCFLAGIDVAAAVDLIGSGWYCRPPQGATAGGILAGGFVPPAYLASEESWLANPANGVSAIPRGRYEGGLYYTTDVPNENGDGGTHEVFDNFSKQVVADPGFRAPALAAAGRYATPETRFLTVYEEGSDNEWGINDGPGQPATPRMLAYDDFLAARPVPTTNPGPGGFLRSLKRRASA